MKKNIANTIFTSLFKLYPNPRTELKYINRFTFLISVVLSAQATDVSVNIATKELFKIAKTPKEMIKLGEIKLKKYIKNIGLYLEEEGRSIEEDHYGVIIGTYVAKSREDAMDMIYAYTNRFREDIPLASYTLAGTPEQIREMIEEYRVAGISKFILRLACGETESLDQLAWLAETIAKPMNLVN